MQVTIELTGRMLPGTEIAAALTALDAMQVDVIGLNCATGPAEMGEPLRHLSANSRVPISCLPNAGLPSVVDGRMHYDLTPDQLADYLHRFVTELGVTAIGGCCGTTPAHLAAVVERCAGATPAARRPVPEPAAASIYTAVPFHQDTSFLVVGERTNANGSKKFREAMLAGDWDTCVAMAREQVKEGAHVIDVCVDYTGADGVADMTEVASRFATQSSVPLMVDSTEGPVVRGRAGSGSAAGRCSTRSTSRRATARAPASTRSSGWPASSARPSSAPASTRRARPARPTGSCGPPGPSTTSPSTATASSRATCSSTRWPSRCRPAWRRAGRTGSRRSRASGGSRPSCPVSTRMLGLSNVSFGLNPAARQVLNSVFLHECVEAGLDAAIVHASKILPLSRIDERAREVCLDLVYDRRRDGYDPLQELLALFEGVSAADQAARRAPRLAGRAAARAADHRRQPQRPRSRPRRGAGRRPPARSTSSTTSCSPG